MEKTEIIRMVVEAVGVFALTFFASKQFRYKSIIVKIIQAAKDMRISETEFQEIVDEVKTEIYGKK